MTTPSFWLVFDVESVGLHGDGFAVGGIVINAADGATIEEFLFHCPSSAAQGVGTDRAWVETNVNINKPTTAKTPADVRSQFWAKWAEWQAKGAWLAADVAWPVEANFLAACLADQWQRSALPIYPLIDIASVRLGVRRDPLATEARLESELPKHDPLCDARQSARLLMEALKRGRNKR